MSWRDNFARLATASGLSNLADGVFQITLPLVALGITRDPAAFASVTLVGRLPWLLFSLPAGALADRLDRRRTMTLVDLGRALVIGGLAAVVAAGLEELWLLYVVAFGLGVGETLFDTAAQSILPNVVDDPNRLSVANGRLYAIELTANQFVGPPLGGLIAGITLAGALGGSAAAYALAAGVLVLLVGRFRPVARGRPDPHAIRHRRGRPLPRPPSPPAHARRRASASPTSPPRPRSPCSRCSPSSPARWASPASGSVCSSRRWPSGP